MDQGSRGKGGALVDAAAAGLAFAMCGAALVFAFVRIDAWAMRTFARPPLAAALIAVIDVALFAAAITLVPLVSELLVRVMRFGGRRGSART